MRVAHVDAGGRRQRARLLDAPRRAVERVDGEPLPRQPDAVPALAVGHAEHPRAGREEPRAADEERVRLGAEEVVVAARSGRPSLGAPGCTRRA